MHNFRKLKIYQKSLDFSVLIYELTKTFPQGELFGLTNQIRRAVVSISLNIAEGSGNKSTREFKRYLEIALRSTYEVMSCLEIAFRLGYSNKEDYSKLITESDEIAALIVGFSRQL
jgi:four helix bundle protein